MAKREEDNDVKSIIGFDPSVLKKEWRDKIKAGEDFKDNELIAISTGSARLDWALRLPFLEGSMVEIFGPSTSGKTTLALEVCANAMRLGKLVFYIDLEYKLREAQLTMIEDFDRSKFTIVYPDTGEEAMDIMHELMIDYPGCVIVLDSVGGLLPETENADDFAKQSMGVVARLCHKMVRKLTGINSRNKCLTIFLNHLTSTMAAYGKSETTHGGKAITNRASQRIELKTLSVDALTNDKNEKIGQMVTATVVKNNVHRPFISVKFPIVYGRGIDKAFDLLEFAVSLGIIGNNRGWYTVIQEDGSEKKFRQTDLLELIKTDKSFSDSLKEKIKVLFE